MELVDVMFGFFQGIADEDAFTFGVDLEHVFFGFLTGPAENAHEDMGYVAH